MAACELECKRGGSPTPSMVRSAMASACVVGDLHVIANMFTIRCGVARATRRQDLIAQIEQRVVMSEHMGVALFSHRAVDNMLATSSLRPKAKIALRLNHCRRVARETPGYRPHSSAATRAFPAEGTLLRGVLQALSAPVHNRGAVVPGALSAPVHNRSAVMPGALSTPARRTTSEMFARGFSGDIARSAIPAITLAQAAATLPFYEIIDGVASGAAFPTAFGIPIDMKRAFGAGAEEAAGLRILLCFVTAPPGAAMPPSGTNLLVWPPAAATIRLGTTRVSRRGTAALPIDVTDAVRRGDSLLVTGARKGAPLLGMKALFIPCRYDAASAGGDAAHFLRFNYVPVTQFTAKGLRSADADAVEIGFYRVPMVCPLSMTPIKTPVRSTTCHHAQCFDLGSLLLANATTSAPKWECPMCLAPATPDKLEVDDTIRHAIESGTRSEILDLDSTCTMWREVTGEAWRNPVSERTAAMAAKGQDCEEFGTYEAGIDGVQWGPAGAGQHADADVGDAAMAFGMDLPPDDGGGG